MTALAKGRRFSILKRDKFRCRYCGRSAPDVILHVDHVDPRANGGGNEEDNLVTACIDCNLGKSADTIPVSAWDGGWWLVRCDFCHDPIETQDHGLIRWSKSHCRIAHKSFAHPLQCDRQLDRQFGRGSWDQLDHIVGNPIRPDGIMPRLLWIIQCKVLAPPIHEWIDCAMRLSVPGYEEAKPILTESVCGDIGIPTPDREVARLTPSFCRWVIDAYGDEA